uniref:hypothetical protein n=1 Tax=Frankia sp. Cr1 TaxID=3073931 RepID=UPI002AD52B3C
LPSRRLQWHYRSKDERLITFSNVHIYDNDLITFPGVLTGTPVEHVLVDGRLSPGQQAPAPEEVEAVVDLVLRHAEQRPTESLGVITMGISRRNGSMPRCEPPAPGVRISRTSSPKTRSAPGVRSS